MYPKNKNKPWNITDEQILTLVNQLADLEQKGKRIWLRFAPENNGNWNEFGQQPSKYIQLWERVYKLVKQGTKKTALVWSPSFGTGYPYGGRPDISPDDLKRLDTNGNGVLDKGDDPYSPYYPGDEFVDWVGISIYNFGLQWPWIDNAIAAPGKFEDYYKGFYDKFSKDRKKPCMISEHAAAFHIDSPNGHGVGELAVKQSWVGRINPTVEFYYLITSIFAYSGDNISQIIRFGRPIQTQKHILFSSTRRRKKVL